MTLLTEFMTFVTLIENSTKVGLTRKIVFQPMLGPDEAGYEGFYYVGCLNILYSLF